MAYARIGVYQLKPGVGDAVREKVRSDFVPLIREQPGFLSYLVVKTGEDTEVTIGVWESAADAEAASGLATSWVTANIAAEIVSATNHAGEVAIAEQAVRRTGKPAR